MAGLRDRCSTIAGVLAPACGQRASVRRRAPRDSANPLVPVLASHGVLQERRLVQAQFAYVKLLSAPDRMIAQRRRLIRRNANNDEVPFYPSNCCCSPNP